MNPYREQLAWSHAGVLAVGSDDVVHLLDLVTGTPRARIDLGDDLFGNLGLAEDQLTMFVLGRTDVIAVDQSLRMKWRARDVAVDGTILHEAADGIVCILAEMDPPGGWFEVTLDAATGREISRKPSFTEDYIGIHGTGSAHRRP